MLNNRALFALAVMAMLLGMLLAWSQLAVRWGNTLPDFAVAQVGEQWVHRDALQRAINGINAERRTPLSPAEQAAVLDKLIAERLLVQYGQDLGLVHSNPAVRNPLVQAVLGMLRANADAVDIDEATARHWYAKNNARFTQHGQWRVQYYRAKTVDVAQQLAEQLQANSAISPERLRQQHVQHITHLPAVLLPVNKLRDYLGSTLTTAITQVTTPQVLAPIALAQGWAVLHVLQIQPGETPAFAAMQPQVIAAMQREASEQALADLLQDLRGEYGVVTASE